MLTMSWMVVMFLGVISQGTIHLAKDLTNAMEVIYEWKYIDFVPNDGKEYSKNYSRLLPIDVDRWRSTVFVTVSRHEKGVPSSLNVISNKNGPGGPLLAPYPDWSWADVNNCSAIINVNRVAIDRCDRLWVLDTGVIGMNSVCNAKLVVFDLRTSRLVERIEIPKDIATNSTTGKGLLVTPVVQTFGPNCEDATVYIADVFGYGLIVYNDRSFRRLTSSAFEPDPRYENHTIEGQTFQVAAGIFGMALSVQMNLLHFNSLSSHNLNAVRTRPLLQGREPVYIVNNDVLWTQASAEAASRTGAIFFGLVGDTSIACIHELDRKTNIEVIAKNRETLQFTTGLKVKAFGKSEEFLFALSNRYQKAATYGFNISEVNFRILRGNVLELINGTKCLSSQK